MNKELFFAHLKDTDRVLDDNAILELQQVVKEYPYFMTAKLMLLKNMKETQHPEYLSTLKKVAVECSDREKLFYFLNEDRFARFFPKTISESGVKKDRTELLLQSFLESIEKNDEDGSRNYETDIQLATNSIISTDYLAYLEKVEPKQNQSEDTQEARPMKHQELLDSFLEKSSEGKILFLDNKDEADDRQNSTQDVDSLLDDDTFFTETLAQVYIKQKKYQQALTIIKRLSLNFPKKSIYFADQIRFLEYLIINDKNKKQK